MARASTIYCPQCRDIGQPKFELLLENPEPHIFRCSNNHAFDREQLLARNPDMVKVVPQEKPQPNDVKVEFWIDKNVLETFRARCPHGQNATVQSILSLYALGDPIIIDGAQAKKLRDVYKVRNGQEILASLEVSAGIEGELQTAQGEVKRYETLIASAMGRLPE